MPAPVVICLRVSPRLSKADVPAGATNAAYTGNAIMLSDDSTTRRQQAVSSVRDRSPVPPKTVPTVPP